MWIANPVAIRNFGCQQIPIGNPNANPVQTWTNPNREQSVADLTELAITVPMISRYSWTSLRRRSL
jgi:hypothetical protein